MIKYRRFFSFLCCILLAVSMTGCGYRAETESGTTPYAAAASMESTPIVDYAVPQMSANILVDLRGYSSWDIKRAALKGRDLPEVFRLIDAETGGTVYNGTISSVRYNEELNLYMGYADFSSFTKEGRYYLECDMIGQSYRFEIREQYYRELLDENCELMAAECATGALSVADAMELLEAFEWYGTIFADEDEDQLPDVLEALKTWVSHKESLGVEDEETALYAAFLAKFSFNYQNYDRQYATDCLKRASTVFGQVQNSISKDADSFFALTELYRATGLLSYNNQIVDYKSFFENNSSYLEEVGYLYGIMTYMATRQKVDVDMCEAFIGKLMDRSEEISVHCEEMIHPVTARNNGSEELLKRALVVSCVNYVMNIYQYTNIVEEILHYLMGENLESMSFYEQDTDKSGYLLLLAQMAAHATDFPQE